ncbi:helix-turn-helix domain-containing protein [Deinococcus saxicola]
MQTEFGKDVYLGRTYEFMRAAGFSPQKPRPQHVGGDETAREAFKTKS